MRDIVEIVLESVRIPKDPIGDADKTRKDLIDQILEFQARYHFGGPAREREWLQGKSDTWLKRMNNFQIMAIAYSMVADRRISSSPGASTIE
ncbi:hypothetical protein ABT282_07920 [Streptomyces sp. NPDC000927]|uniref:hypothetical protein n=1 Tax=Streptomyces sp. NPDC000927 TaxID=3154371 RepID=UPI0033267B3F